MSQSLLLDYLKKQKKAFQEQARRTYRDPTGKNVHSLRVITRRLRVAVRLAGQGSPGLSFKKLSSSLRKLGKVLGARREMDVAVQDAAHYKLRGDNLKAQHTKMKKDVLAEIDPSGQKDILRQIESLIKKIKKHPELDFTSGLTKIRKKLMPWVRKTAVSKSDLHRLRISTKKARYTLEAFRRPSRPLRELQSVLGRIHDLEVLQKTLGKNARVQIDVNKQRRKAKALTRRALSFAIRELSTLS